MTSLRTFIAIDFPKEVIKQIVAIQKSLNDSISSVVRWTTSENTHLTLKFLGEIESAKELIIEKTLDDITNEINPFYLNLKGIGVFPNWHRPRIVWIGIEKSQPLYLLAKLIEEKMFTLGCQKEIKPFSPHLTIGRVRDNISNEDIQVLEKRCLIHTINIDRILISQIHLYKSDLHSFGPIYTLLNSSSFKATL